MNIQVGDRVTYKYLNTEDKRECIAVIQDIVELEDYKRMIENKSELCSIEILKIERPKWEVVEEKKELLTEEEREFLKFFIKHFEVESFRFNDNDIDVKSFEDTYICCPDYPKNMKFEGVEKYKKYDLKELRIGGINNGFICNKRYL